MWKYEPALLSPDIVKCHEETFETKYIFMTPESTMESFA